MDEGEPPDETGERDAEGADAATDGSDAGQVSGDEGEVAPPGDEPAPDATDDGSDPGEEVEEAVRDVMGPDALADQGDFEDGVGDDGDGAADADASGSAVADPADETDGQSGAGRETTEATDRSASADAGGAADRTERAEEGDPATATATDDDSTSGTATASTTAGEPRDAGDVPEDVRKYDRFKKIDGGTYDRANEFLRDRTYITAREWAIARLCADFRTETGVEMTKIGENLPELVPFMTDTYTPQAVNQARAAFEEKVRKAGATFLYGAMCDFFTAEELDDVMYEATEVAKFLLEVEGVELSVDEELAAEDHISEVMRDVREHSAALRHDEVTCPECGHQIEAGEHSR